MSDQNNSFQSVVAALVELSGDMLELFSDELVDLTPEEFVASMSLSSDDNIGPHVDTEADDHFTESCNELLLLEVRASPLINFLGKLNYPEDDVEYVPGQGIPSGFVLAFSNDKVTKLRNKILIFNNNVSSAKIVIDMYLNADEKSTGSIQFIKLFIDNFNRIADAINNAVSKHNKFFRVSQRHHIQYIADRIDSNL